MTIPDELKYLAKCFYQRSDLEYETPEEWIQSTVQDFLSAKKRQVVKLFLDDLLNGPQSDDELQKIWEGLDSDYWFQDGAAVRRFLSMVRVAAA